MENQAEKVMENLWEQTNGEGKEGKLTLSITWAKAQAIVTLQIGKGKTTVLGKLTFAADLAELQENLLVAGFKPSAKLANTYTLPAGFESMPY